MHRLCIDDVYRHTADAGTIPIFSGSRVDLTWENTYVGGQVLNAELLDKLIELAEKRVK